MRSIQKPGALQQEQTCATQERSKNLAECLGALFCWTRSRWLIRPRGGLRNACTFDLKCGTVGQSQRQRRTQQTARGVPVGQHTGTTSIAGEGHVHRGQSVQTAVIVSRLPFRCTTTHISILSGPEIVSHCSVAEWLGCLTCDQQVAGSNPDRRAAVGCNSGQVVYTHVPLSTRQCNLVPVKAGR